jgi:hypothetical protein
MLYFIDLLSYLACAASHKTKMRHDMVARMELGPLSE